jgi:hypothetical protein
LDTFGRPHNSSFMRIWKFVLIGLITLVVAFLSINLFAPSRVQFEKTMVIEAEPEALFAICNNLSTWSSWNPSFHRAVNLQNTFVDSTGSNAEWILNSEGDEVGRVRTEAWVENRLVRVTVDLQERKDWMQIEWSLEGSPNGTKILCRVQTEKSSFFWKFLNLGLRSQMETYYDGALLNLKNRFASNPKESNT